MIASTIPGTHNPRISAQTVTNRLLEICERPPYTMYVLHAAFLFWPSICNMYKMLATVQIALFARGLNSTIMYFYDLFVKLIIHDSCDFLLSLCEENKAYDDNEYHCIWTLVLH